MESFLPSEVGRLIYGYLVSECNEELGENFLSTSKIMEECRLFKQSRFRKFNSKIQGLSLVEILDQYSILCSMIFKKAENRNCSHQNILTTLQSILHSKVGPHLDSTNETECSEKTEHAAASINTSHVNIVTNVVNEVCAVKESPSKMSQITNEHYENNVSGTTKLCAIKESPSKTFQVANEQYDNNVANIDEGYAHVFPSLTNDEHPMEIDNTSVTMPQVLVTNENQVDVTKIPDTEIECSQFEHEVPMCEDPLFVEETEKNADASAGDVSSTNPQDTRTVDLVQGIVLIAPVHDKKPKSNVICKKLKSKAEKAKPRLTKSNNILQFRTILPKSDIQSKIKSNENQVFREKANKFIETVGKETISTNPSPVINLTFDPNSKRLNNSTPMKFEQSRILSDNTSLQASANGEKQPWDVNLRRFLVEAQEPAAPHKTPCKTPRKCRQESKPSQEQDKGSARKRKAPEYVEINTNLVNGAHSDLEDGEIREASPSKDVAVVEAALSKHQNGRAKKRRKVKEDLGTSEPYGTRSASKSNQVPELTAVSGKTQVLLHKDYGKCRTHTPYVATNVEPATATNSFFKTVCESPNKSIQNTLYNGTTQEHFIVPDSLELNEISNSPESSNGGVEINLTDEIVLFEKFNTVS